MNDLTRRATLAGLVSTGLAGSARAAEWPERPVTWLLPFSAGGPTDIFSRPIAAHVGARLGQTMVIDNRSGAGGTIAAATAARAAPDGYTLLMGYTGHAYAPVIYPKAGFDLARDFAAVSAIARVASVLVINPARLNVSSLAEFMDTARQKPGSINIASAGLGTVPHLAIEALQARANIKLNHVPYRGGAPALQDLLAGQVDAMFMPIAIIAAHIKSGKLRALAIAGRRPERMLPDVPTFDAAGLADFRATSWFALFAPKRTPEPVLARLHEAVQSALAEEDVKQVWAEQAARVELESRADFARFVTLEIERWSRIARLANVQME